MDTPRQGACQQHRPSDSVLVLFQIDEGLGSVDTPHQGACQQHRPSDSVLVLFQIDEGLGSVDTRQNTLGAAFYPNTSSHPEKNERQQRRHFGGLDVPLRSAKYCRRSTRKERNHEKRGPKITPNSPRLARLPH